MNMNKPFNIFHQRSCRRQGSCLVYVKRKKCKKSTPRRRTEKTKYGIYLLEKHSLQYTGRSPRGWNGTWVFLPHSAQIAENISLRTPPFFLASLQALHLWGSLVNPFSAKNSCSLAVNVNSLPQSLQVIVLSWNMD